MQDRGWQRGEQRARKAAWLAVSLCALSPACAGQGAQVTASGQAAAQGAQAELESLRAQLAERDRRLNQLEGRLSLLEASQRELRYALAESAREPLRNTVTLGERAPVPEAGPRKASKVSPAESAREESRPVLRLYEERSSKVRVDNVGGGEGASDARGGRARSPLMPVPEVTERLPVAPVPSLTSVSSSAPAASDPTEQYKRALDLVRQRAFPQALRVLDDFVLQFGRDPRVAKAMFWRGEVLFAQRDYAAALRAYEASLSKEPRGEKAPDSLLKIGLCHRHLGASQRAREAMRELRTQFPESAAARLLSEEDA